MVIFSSGFVKLTFDFKKGNWTDKDINLKFKVYMMLFTYHF